MAGPIDAAMATPGSTSVDPTDAGGHVRVAVIGAGLIGAAAARHLAEAGVSVALIGASEPADLTTSDGPFASHWDQGRITRVAGRTEAWSLIARRSIDRYRDLAARSGVSFHTPRAMAMAGPDAPLWVDRSHANGGRAELMSAADFERSTGIHVPSGSDVSVEGPPAGFINPRRLRTAELVLAERAGARRIDGVVEAIHPASDRVEMVSTVGTIAADRVIIATGAFGERLLGGRVQVERRPRTLVLAEIDDDRSLPSLLLRDPSHPDLEEIYWVPPVEYPDGRRWLKIGGRMRSAPVATADEIVEWFQSGGSPQEVDALQATVRELLPNTTVRRWRHRPCVMTHTPSEHPIIDWLDERVVVAIGGNGSAAKCCDELGRLAADLVRHGEWIDDVLSPDTFAAQPAPVGR